MQFQPNSIQTGYSLDESKHPVNARLIQPCVQMLVSAPLLWLQGTSILFRFLTSAHLNIKRPELLWVLYGNGSVLLSITDITLNTKISYYYHGKLPPYCNKLSLHIGHTTSVHFKWFCSETKLVHFPKQKLACLLSG